MLIAAAPADEWDLQTGDAPAHVVVDLSIDLLVAFEQLQHQFLPVLLLLRLLVDVVLEKLLLVQLQQRVKLQQLVRIMLLPMLFPLGVYLALPLLLMVVTAVSTLSRWLYCLLQRLLLLTLGTDLLYIQFEVHSADGYWFSLPFFIRITSGIGIEVAQSSLLALAYLIEVTLQFLRLAGELFGCKINDILAILLQVQLLTPQNLRQHCLHTNHLATHSALLEHRPPHPPRRCLEQFHHARRQTQHLPVSC